MTDDGKWSVRDTLTGAIYHQPNKLIAQKVAEMHGNCEVVPGWPSLTPPTDDEREALKEVLGPVLSGTISQVADAVISAGFRRQGPITDEWEYEHLTRYSGEYVSTWRPCGPNGHGTKRRRRKAGPWEDVK